MTYVNKSIVDLVKKNLNYSRFRWSSAVGLDEKESTLVITLSPENTQNSCKASVTIIFNLSRHRIINFKMI